MKHVVRQAAIFLGKALVLYLSAPILLVDLILMQAALPHFLFIERAFVLSALLVVLSAAAFSIWNRSKLPMLFAVLCLSYSFVFLTDTYAIIFVGMLMLVAAFHFVFPNRFTEPLLVILPIAAGAWVFLSVVYLPFSVAWANFVTARMGYLESAFEGIGQLGVQSIQALIVLPLLVMYFLAANGHIRLLAWIRSLRSDAAR